MAVSQKRTMIPSDSGYMKARRFPWVKFTESQWKRLIYNPKILGAPALLNVDKVPFFPPQRYLKACFRKTRVFFKCVKKETEKLKEVF